MNTSTPMTIATEAEREGVLSNASKLPFHGRNDHITVYRTLDGWRSIQSGHPLPALNIWDFLGAKARDMKKTHPRGHHLSDEEISYYRRDGIPADRVRALLYGGIDCPKVDCRGRCKIKDETSQVHEIQDNSIQGTSEILRRHLLDATQIQYHD